MPTVPHYDGGINIMMEAALLKKKQQYKKRVNNNKREAAKREYDNRSMYIWCLQIEICICVEMEEIK